MTTTQSTATPPVPMQTDYDAAQTLLAGDAFGCAVRNVRARGAMGSGLYAEGYLAGLDWRRVWPPPGRRAKLKRRKERAR